MMGIGASDRGRPPHPVDRCERPSRW